MSADAIADLTSAIRNRIEDAVGQSTVHIGPPVSADLTAGESITLFLFHLEPNRDLRNVEHLVDPPGGGPDDLLVPSNALPLDLRYVISVFRRPSNAVDPVELRLLGQLVQALAAQPTYTDPVLPGQSVRLTPEPYPMEEMSRVWGLFPTTPYQSSIVYLAAPVLITYATPAAAAPVVERRLDGGVLTEVGP
ncbi:MAG: DUF4255 domain-containing protein [Aeromicrobium sp.]